MSRPSRATQGGLSLIELIVYIVVVTVGILGILSVLNVSTRDSADPMLRKQVLAVAEAMLEEVLSKDFANPAGGFTPATPGHPTQAERPRLDDVGDYHMDAGWNWTGVTSLVDTATTIAGLENHSVTVTVVPTAAFNGLPASDARAVTVAVNGGGQVVTLLGFRTRYEP